ncbi:hypothetical protein D9M68_770280 [compost metagenome]
MRPALRLGTPHHGLDYFAADCTDSTEQLFGHTQLPALLPIGIGDVTGLEPGRTTRHTGNGLGNTAAGTRLGSTHLDASRLQPLPQFGGQPGKALLIDSHLHSGVKASQGDTVH